MSTILSVYYQRDWSNAIPQDWTNTGAHIARLASPFLGLYYPGTGHIISNASAALNFFSVAIRMNQGRGDWSDAWVLVKTTAEFAGNATNVKMGVLVHTGLSLTENLFSLRKFRQLTWSQVGEKIIPIVSNGLYLATFYNFSKKVSYAVIGASLLFQACLSACKAEQSRRAIKRGTYDINIVDTAVHAALTVVFFLKARTCYQEFAKIERVVARFRGPSMVKVEPIVAPDQPAVVMSTEMPATKQEKAPDSKSGEPLPLSNDVEKPKASIAVNSSKDPVKHYRVKRDELEGSADLAQRWETLDRILDKITN